MTRGADALAQFARQAHRNVVAGRFQGLAGPLAELEATTHPVARAWAAALRAELWLAEPRYGLRPAPELLVDFVDGPALSRSGALAAISSAVRAAAIGFDGATLSRLAPLARDLARGLDEDAELSAELTSAWAELYEGRAESAFERASELGRRASRASSSAVLIDAQAVRALASNALGEHERALELARRGSLMARTESIPQPEFLAHMALARARRMQRQPHLALRILEALASVLPAPWSGWHAWESAFAGSLSAPAHDAFTLPARAATTLLSLAREGERTPFERAAGGLLEAVSGAAPMRAEATELVAALDPSAPGGSEALVAWRSGLTPLTPPAIHGLRARPAEGEDSAAAYVVTAAGAAGQRVLHWGVPLFERESVERIRQSQRAQGRVETLLSILALAGPDGIDESACFREAYGFPMVPEVHRGVFDVLVHRTRTELGDRGRIERNERTLALLSDRTLLIPDPRVSHRTTDRLLRLLAERGTASAKDAASALGISLRSAQAALAELAGDGACETRKDGRSVAYVVEDTVFSEPSRRLLASDLSGLTRL